MKFTPHKGQLIGIKYLVTHPEAGLLQDPGFGKTSQVLAATLQLRRTGAVKKTLVVCPLRVAYRVWSQEGEIGKWDQFKDVFKVSLLHGAHKEEALAADADLYVINYDGLDWLTAPRDRTKAPGVRNQSRLDELLARGVDCLVLDELSKFKHHGTKRFKTLKRFLPMFKRRWGLTGSPAANGLLDLFGEAYVLDMGKALGPYITHYRFKYFLPGGYMNKEWRPAEGAEAKIYQALKPLMLSMRAEDYLDMPELVEQDVWVDLPPAARKFYDEFEEEMIAEFDGETHVAGSAGVVSGKCRQIASGGVYYAAQRKKGELYHGEDSIEGPSRNVYEMRQVHQAKTEALGELIEELQGQPLLVGFDYKHDRARIETLGVKHFIDGSTSMKESNRLCDEWNAGKISVLCVHPQAAGHGLNLQGSSCAHVAWYTVPWDFDLYTQTIDRVYRQGTKARTVFVHRILARATVDVVVSRALRVKERTQDALMMALRDYTNTRKR
jgi:SNF2 family DNA or RNA helicase